jgi:Phage integrase family
MPDITVGEWAGNLRDRLLFTPLAETGMRLGEALGLRICDFVMGRGSIPYVEIVPCEYNTNGARVKMMRPRRICVGCDLERLFADYLTQLVWQAAEFGIGIDAGSPLPVNLDRPPLPAALREGTVRDKVSALRKRSIGPASWTPHRFRHSHATALPLAGTPEWVVSRRLGHAHVQTTLDPYGWVREDEAPRAAANWKSYISAWQVDDGRTPAPTKGRRGDSTELHPPQLPCWPTALRAIPRLAHPCRHPQPVVASLDGHGPALRTPSPDRRGHHRYGIDLCCRI